MSPGDTGMVGIEALNVFGGSAVLALDRLCEYRQLDRSRFDNLLMKEKTVALPCEDPVTFAVNAAAPIVAALLPAEREQIELLVTCTESGIDFGKSLSTYVHQHLGLSRHCRLFEIKQACYSGTAGLQMAASHVLSQVSPGAKALVVATDIARFTATRADGETPGGSFSEPSNGAGAVALLVSDRPDVFEIDIGANGFYGHEVMDTCRPTVDGDVGDADLSLLSYLDSCEASYRHYAERVNGADFRSTFDYLAFHTPFGGMVKGAHRTMMRKLAGAAPSEIEADFARRVLPGLNYCQRVGNIMGGTVFLALASVIDHADFTEPRRIGCYSYGSGSCSEFYSGSVTPEGQARLRRMNIGRHLDQRYALSVEEYESVLIESRELRFGAREVTPDPKLLAAARKSPSGGKRLYLGAIRNYHREYEWA